MQKRIKEENKGKEKTDLKAYTSDYDNINTGLKNFMEKNTSSVFAKSAVVMASHIYKQLDNYKGLKSYLQSIIGNKNLSSLTGIAKRSLIDYYNNQKDYTSVITLADEIIKENGSDDEMICDAKYVKGLLYEYSLNKKDEAISLYADIVKNYEEVAATRMAVQQLKNLGIDIQANKKNEKTTNDQTEELTFATSNYPNPFNPTTTISYSLPTDGKVQIKVFDVLGREVSTLIDGYVGSGKHSVVWDGSNFASGIYFYTITFENQVLNKKILLIK